MKHILTLILALGLFTLSPNTNAEPGWSGQATVESIYTLHESSALIKLSNFSNPNNCKVDDSGHLILNPSVDKSWYSVFLTAYATKATVNVYVVANCTEVWANTSYAKIGHVKLL